MRLAQKRLVARTAAAASLLVTAFGGSVGALGAPDTGMEIRPGPVTATLDDGTSTLLTDTGTDLPGRSAGFAEGELEPELVDIGDGFQIEYSDAVPADAKPAIEAAVTQWDDVLNPTVPVVVKAHFVDLDNNPMIPDGVLAVGGPKQMVLNGPGGSLADLWYPIGLANQYAGEDLTDGADLFVSFNLATDWDLSVDGAGSPGQFNLQSIAAHEMGHGLGFSSGFALHNDGIGNYDHPTIFDHFVVDPDGNRLLEEELFEPNSTGLGDALKGDLFWGGPAGFAADGTAPVLFAPETPAPGSAYVHLDEATYPAGNPNAVMTPGVQTGEVFPEIGSVVVGIVDDMGWETGPAEPVAGFVDAPQITVDGSSVTVTWAAPENFEPVSYNVTISDGDDSTEDVVSDDLAADMDPLAFETELPDGTYTATVTATNTEAATVVSAPSDPFTVGAHFENAPQVSVNGSSVTVTWEAPKNFEPVSYNVTFSDEDDSTDDVVSGDVAADIDPLMLETELPDGDYTATVTATNTEAVTVVSAPSDPFTVGARFEHAPEVSVDGSSVTVKWEAPTNVVIESYVATLHKDDETVVVSDPVDGDAELVVTFEDVPDGTWQASVTGTTSDDRTVVSERSTKFTVGEAPAASGHVVSGVVKDSNGNPVKGATVTISPVLSTGSAPVPLPVTRLAGDAKNPVETTDDGKFVFDVVEKPGVEVEAMIVTMLAPVCDPSGASTIQETQTRRLTLPDGGADTNFVTVCGADISGSEGGEVTLNVALPEPPTTDSDDGDGDDEGDGDAVVGAFALVANNATINWGDHSPVTNVTAPGANITGTHTYTAPGTYTIVVKTLDGAGNTTWSTTRAATITNTAPTLDVTDPVIDGATVTVTGTITDPGAAPTTVSVAWGDNTVTSTDQIVISDTGAFSAQHTYLNSGAYQIIVSGSDGTDTVTVTQAVEITAGVPAPGPTTPVPVAGGGGPAAPPVPPVSAGTGAGGDILPRTGSNTTILVFGAVMAIVAGASMMRLSRRTTVAAVARLDGTSQPAGFNLVDGVAGIGVITIALAALINLL